MEITSENPQSRRPWWRVLVILIPLAVVVLLDLLAAALYVGWQDRFSWASITAGPHRAVGAVVLTIRVKNQALRATYRLTLPRRGSLVELVQNGTATSDPQALAEAIGRITVAGEPLGFEPPTLGLQENSPNATVSLRSEARPLSSELSQVTVAPYRPDGPPEQGDCCFPPVRVAIETDGAKVLSDQEPTTQSAKRTVYSGLAKGLTFQIRLDRSKPKARGVPARQALVPKVETVDLWRSRIETGEKGPVGAVELTLTIKDQGLTAAYRLSLPVAAHGRSKANTWNLLDALRREPAAQDPQSLVGFLGAVMVDGDQVPFKAPLISVGAGAQEATVFMTSETVRLRRERPRVLVAAPLHQGRSLPPTRVVVKTEGAQVTDASRTEGGEVPNAVWRNASQSAAETVFPDIRGELDLGLLLSPFDEQHARAPQRTLLAKLHKVEVPGLSWCLYWLVVSLPAVAFLWWQREPNAMAVAGEGRSRRVVKLLLAFYLIAMVVSGLASLMERWPLATPIARLLHDKGIWQWARPEGWTGGPALMVAAMAVLWPHVVRRPPPAADDQRPAARLHATRAILVEAGLAAGLVVLLVQLRRSFLDGAEAASLTSFGVTALVVTALLLSVLLWLLWSALSVRMSGAERVGVLLLLLVFPVTYSLFEDQRPATLFRGVVVTAAGALVLKGMLEVSRHSLELHPHIIWSWRSRLLDAVPWAVGFSRSWRWLVPVVVAAVLVVLAVPTFGIFGNPHHEAVDGWSMMKLSDWLVYALAICLGLVVLAQLRSTASQSATPKDASVFSPQVRTLGVLFALALLFEPFIRFAHLPVVLIVGYLLVSHWLLLHDDSPIAGLLRFQLNSSSRERLITLVVERAEKTNDSGRKLHVPSRQEGGNPREFERDRAVAMSLAPRDSPWDNGILFARYSLWLALPWTLFYFVPRELDLWLRDSQYPILGPLLALAWYGIQWPALGFFLGYFYPAIRGSNGLWKGLSTAVVYIVPFVSIDLLFWLVGELDTWQRTIVWATQVFITSVLTGFLAGELQMLWQSGYGWRQMTSIHNFRALAAWGSSVAVALGSAIVTLLTTTIGEVVTSQLMGGGPAVPGGR